VIRRAGPRLAAAASLLTLLTWGAFATAGGGTQRLIFRVKATDLFLQRNTLAHGKTADDFVEVTLPGTLYAPPFVLAPEPKASTTWNTPRAAATADFSANKADDAQWIVDNFVPAEQAEIKRLLQDKELRDRNRAIVASEGARYLGGE